MSEQQQLPLLDKQPKMGQPVVYVPPGREVLEQVAEQVCATLDEQDRQVIEVVDGLTTFLTVVARLTAKAATNGKAAWLRDKHPTTQDLKRGA